MGAKKKSSRKQTKRGGKARGSARKRTSDGTNPFGGFTYIDKTGKVKKATVGVGGKQDDDPDKAYKTFDNPGKNNVKPGGSWGGWTDVVYMGATAETIEGYDAPSLGENVQLPEDLHVFSAAVVTDYVDPEDHGQGIQTEVIPTVLPSS